MKIQLGDSNPKAGIEDIFSPTTGNEILREISDGKKFRAVNSATSKNLLRLQRSHIAIYANMLGRLHIGKPTIRLTIFCLTHRRQHSSVLGVRSFRAEDCDTEHCPVVEKVRKRLAVSKY
jgi:hypothetical protein